MALSYPVCEEGEAVSIERKKNETQVGLVRDMTLHGCIEVKFTMLDPGRKVIGLVTKVTFPPDGTTYRTGGSFPS